MDWPEAICRSFQNIWLFGSYIPYAKRTKLQDKSNTEILVGVNEESKWFRVYNPITIRVVISNDVIFEEVRK